MISLIVEDFPGDFKRPYW